MGYDVATGQGKGKEKEVEVQEQGVKGKVKKRGGKK
jgi:hypothetical protein